MAAVAISPTSGNITSLVTVVNITCSAVASNDSAAYSTLIYPTEPEITYYFKLAKSGSDSLKSPLFAPTEGGVAYWDNVIFPSAGTWTLTINKSSDDSVTATTSVVVA